MIMARALSVIIFLSVGLLAGCSSDNGRQLYETAQLEERQHNNEHAGRLYEEIIKKYPGSEHANLATERLKALRKR